MAPLPLNRSLAWWMIKRSRRSVSSSAVNSRSIVASASRSATSRRLRASICVTTASGSTYSRTASALPVRENRTRKAAVDFDAILAHGDFDAGPVRCDALRRSLDAILAHGDFDEAHRTGPVLRRHADPGRLRVPPPRAVRDDRFGERRVTAVEDPNPQNLGLSLPRLLEIRRAAAREPGGDVTGEALRCKMEPSDLEQVVRSRRAQPHHDRQEEGQAPEPPAQPATERTFKLVNHSIDYRRSAPLRWQIFEHFGCFSRWS